MLDGERGFRFEVGDPNQLGNPQRDRTRKEIELLADLSRLEEQFRDLLNTTPSNMDGRSRATALTKLDELVMWAKKGIDA